MNKYLFLLSLTFLISTTAFGQNNFFKKLFSKKAKKEKQIETQTLHYSSYVHEKIIPSQGIEIITPAITNECSEAELEEERCVFQKGITTADGLYIPFEYLNQEDFNGIWDSKTVNPYGYNILNFKDSLKIKMDAASFHSPLNNTEINSKYGWRRWRWHHGVDLDLEIGDSVFASFDGIVRIAKFNRRGYGYYVMLRHKNGLETLYGHLSKFNVKVGDTLKAGELLGFGGNTGRSTGPHLHYEIRYKGNGLDPSVMIDFEHATCVDENFIVSRGTYSKLIDKSKSKYVTIRNGDSLWTLSRRHHTSINQLCRINGISRRTTLRVGRRIRVR